MMSTYLITKPDGATRVARIDDSKNLRLAKEELGHRNIDLFGYECVVFIEGDSEDKAFPVIAKSLGFDLCAKGIHLINVRGKDNFLKIEEYLGYMKDSEVITYVIADGNKKVKEHLEDWQRAGIILPNNCTVWELEFEDCFSFSLLAGAINELFRENELESQITVQELEEGKQEGVSIVKTLKIILPQKGLEFRKTDLAEKIAQVLDKKIKEKDHIETNPEAVIKKIVGLVDKKYS
jgi:predicted ATP-dependent endonuclease of OLD family